MNNNNLRELTLGQILDETVSRYPENDAVVYWNRSYRLTYREFSEKVDLLAKGLIALGITKGEKVGVWAANAPYWVELHFAVAKIGAALLTINTNYGASEFEFVLSQSGAENLFFLTQHKNLRSADLLAELLPELATQSPAEFGSERFPSLKRVCSLGNKVAPGAYSIDEVMALGSTVEDEVYLKRQADISCYDLVNMQYTSGTTGFPKGVMLSHFNIGNNGFWIGENQRLGAADRVCLPVPLYHCFGCVLGMMATMTHGSTLVVLEKPDPLHIMTALESESCTALYGVPTTFIGILNHREFRTFDYSRLRTGIMAGSPCPVETMRSVIDKMNLKEITICYGLTEGSPVITQTTVDDSLHCRTATVGRPMPEIEVKLVNPETNATVPTGTQGEVCCRGYNVMLGYFDLPGETAETIDKDGWLHTGDVGIIDSKGYLSITSRYKDLIIRGGENISPREIEEFLHGLEGIIDVQVVGVQSRVYGEEVGAFIILADGCEYSATDIRAMCRTKISRFKIPRHIFFVDEFPMTGSGKVQKYKLREMAKCILEERRSDGGSRAREELPAGTALS